MTPDFAALGFRREDLYPVLTAAAAVGVVAVAGGEFAAADRRELLAALASAGLGYPAAIRLAARTRAAPAVISIVRCAGVALAFALVLWPASLRVGEAVGPLSWDLPAVASDGGIVPAITGGLLAAGLAAALLSGRRIAALDRGLRSVSAALAAGAVVRMVAPAEGFPSWIALVAVAGVAGAWQGLGKGRGAAAAAAVAVTVAGVAAGYEPAVAAAAGAGLGLASALVAGGPAREEEEAR
ncbi:MAG: hypothetical protein FJ087_19095 [Deltaproteobacteria bacterium]|nr:hypothetical protein [Deltaproteobacteria bacterium]